MKHHAIGPAQLVYEPLGRTRQNCQVIRHRVHGIARRPTLRCSRPRADRWHGASAPRDSQIRVSVWLAHEGTRRLSVYESDCQGRSSPLLIAFSCFPLQSALLAQLEPMPRVYGWAEQSYAADSYRCSPEVLSRRLQATCRSPRECQPRFYLRLTPISAGAA